MSFTKETHIFSYPAGVSTEALCAKIVGLDEDQLVVAITSKSRIPSDVNHTASIQLIVATIGGQPVLYARSVNPDGSFDEPVNLATGGKPADTLAIINERLGTLFDNETIVLNEAGKVVLNTESTLFTNAVKSLETVTVLEAIANAETGGRIIKYTNEVGAVVEIDLNSFLTDIHIDSGELNGQVLTLTNSNGDNVTIDLGVFFTESEVNTLASSLITAHEQKANPHTQYALKSEIPVAPTLQSLGGEAAGTADAKVTEHKQEENPHTQYALKSEIPAAPTLQTLGGEAAGTADAKVTEHEQKENPHEQYALKTEIPVVPAAPTLQSLGGEAAGTADTKVTEHEQKENPHEQYALKTEIPAAPTVTAQRDVNLWMGQIETNVDGKFEILFEGAGFTSPPRVFITSHTTVGEAELTEASVSSVAIIKDSITALGCKGVAVSSEVVAEGNTLLPATVLVDVLAIGS